MQQLRVGIWVERFFIATAGMLFSAGCVAQTGVMRACEGAPKGCVEVLLRYYEEPQKPKVKEYGSSKIEILDAKTMQVIGSPCQVCDPKVESGCDKPCSNLQNATLQDASYIILLQSHKSPGCFYICTGGWCRWICT
jgi:hypothetical protein